MIFGPNYSATKQESKFEYGMVSAVYTSSAAYIYIYIYICIYVWAYSLVAPKRSLHWMLTNGMRKDAKGKFGFIIVQEIFAEF